jgi:hypothetical protein
MSTRPGADELRIRGHLIALGVGPDATPPKPTARPRDWLDDILEDDPTPEPEPEPEDAPADPEPKQPPPVPAARRPSRPRQSLADALDGTPTRVRWLVYHATAAAAGWWIGIVEWGTSTAAWFADGHWTSPSAWVLYALGACACGLYRRARSWAWPAAWVAAIPVSSTVAGVLLYGTPIS